MSSEPVVAGLEGVAAPSNELQQPSVVRVVLLLACTALPIALTNLAFVILYGLETPPRFLSELRPAVLAQGLYACALLPFVLLVLAVERQRLKAFGLRFRMTGRRLSLAAVGFVMGVLAFLGTDFVLSALGLPRVAGMDIGRPTLTAAAILVAGPVLVAPFGEELFFRVLWIGMLGQRVPRLLAAVAAIAAFSAYHYPYFGLGGAVFIAVWSIVPVTLFLWTKDITAPLLMHVLNNAFAYVLVPLIGD